MSIPLELPAGILKVDSLNAGKGRYTDCDKVRFEKGFPEKWAGWVLFNDTQLIGICRGAGSWTNAYGNPNAAFGTNVKLYALSGGDTILDITPNRSTGTLGLNPFVTASGSAVVTVNHAAHGADQGDRVFFSGATAVGGITISGEYVIATKISNNAYTIQHTSSALSAATGGGAAVTFAYQISAGSVSTASGLGWGSGRWGEEAWGTPRSVGLTIELRHWSLAPYGNDLLAVPSGETLFLWQEATDLKAEVVPNAPASIRAMFVTGERFVMALGTSTPMTVNWPDRDDITAWTPLPSNTANTRKLQNGSKLIGGAAVSDGVNLVWSDTAVYLFQYTGSEFIYDSRLVADNAGLAGPLAFAVTKSTAFWMSSSDFYRYSGGISIIPRSDEIKEFLFKDIDQVSIDKTWAIYDETTDQVRWHYCSKGSSEPNRYVDVDLSDYSWTPGTLDRTSGTQFQEAAKSTLLVSHDGYIYQHGVGSDADGQPMESYLTYGLYALTNGDKNVDIMGLIPDCERQIGNLAYEVYTMERPNSAAKLDEKTVLLGPSDTIEDLRVEGRHFGMTVRSNVMGGDFRLGIVNLELQPSGDRR
jgi:hypothetical protein